VTARGIPISRDTIAAAARAEARGSRWGVLALWIIAASLMIMMFRGFA
jgi:ubiquinone biosynthesis protein